MYRTQTFIPPGSGVPSDLPFLELLEFSFAVVTGQENTRDTAVGCESLSYCIYIYLPSSGTLFFQHGMLSCMCVLAGSVDNIGQKYWVIESCCILWTEVKSLLVPSGKSESIFAMEKSCKQQGTRSYLKPQASVL